MGYNRINTPRVYTDLISQGLSSGWLDLDDITMLQNDDSTAVSLDTGTESDLYDLRPANSVQIAKENQAFYIQLNTKLSTNALAESNYLAILNHNFLASECMFKVELSDDVNMSSNVTTISNSSNHSKLINATQSTISGNTTFIEADENGWTLIKWTTQTTENQYLRITFKDTGGASQNFADDVIIGSIMYGEYFEFPNAPEIGVTTKIDYDGIKLNKSLGGNSYATATNFGQPEWAKTLSWTNSTGADISGYAFNKRTGRINHSIKFNYLSDTDVWSNNSSSIVTSEWFDTLTAHNSFYNKVIGQFHPFLFSIDKDSTTEGDYGMFRLKDKSFKATQVSDRLWSIAFNIVETW
tara:strand:+ start:3157 stop:4218 length:1062 start_codon:yes stop_codon:yes gene_type:complete